MVISRATESTACQLPTREEEGEKMGEQRNLTEENVEELRAKLEEMHKDNPDLEYRFWEQTKDEGWPSEPQPQDEQPSSKKIFEKLDAIERQLKLIFDGLPTREEGK